MPNWETFLDEEVQTPKDWGSFLDEPLKTQESPLPESDATPPGYLTPEEAWKAQPKTGFLGSFGKEFVGSIASTGRGPGSLLLSEDTLKEHLLSEYAKARTAPQQTGLGKVGGFLGGLAGTIGQAIPIGIATGPAGIIAMFGSQGEYNEFLRAGIKALSEGKTPEEAVKIGRKSGFIGGVVGSALGAIMPARPAATAVEAIAQGAQLGAAAGLGRVGENIAERELGLKTPVTEDVLTEALTTGALPPAGHLFGRALGMLRPLALPEVKPEPPPPIPKPVERVVEDYVEPEPTEVAVKAEELAAKPAEQPAVKAAPEAAGEAIKKPLQTSPVPESTVLTISTAEGDFKMTVAEARKRKAQLEEGSASFGEEGADEQMLAADEIDAINRAFTKAGVTEPEKGAPDAVQVKSADEIPVQPTPGDRGAVAEGVPPEGEVPAGEKAQVGPPKAEVLLSEPAAAKPKVETFEQRMAREEDMNDWIKSDIESKQPSKTAEESWLKYTAFDRARKVEVPGKDYFLSAWESFRKPTPAKPAEPVAGVAKEPTEVPMLNVRWGQSNRMRKRQAEAFKAAGIPLRSVGAYTLDSKALMGLIPDTPEARALAKKMGMTVSKRQWGRTEPAKQPAAAEPAAKTGEGAPGVQPMELQSGLGSLGLGEFTEQDLVPFAKKAADTIRETAQQAKALLIPASMSKEASLGAGVIREKAAELSQKDVQMRAKFADAMKQFDKLGRAPSLDFIDKVETGAAQPTHELQMLSAQLRNQFDARVAQVRALGTGKLQHVITDYFPHIWKDPEAALSWYARMFSRRPLRGPATFLKHRTIPTTKEGMVPVAQGGPGLEPVSTNPIDLTLLKLHEIDRYIMGQKIFQELKDKGLAVFSRQGIPPEGFATINDRIANVIEYRPTVKADGTPGAPERIIRGHWYAQEDVARVLNNFLSPGLERFKWYRALRWVGNTLNMAQLGLSGYHGMFTMIDAGTSKLSLGIEQLGQGKAKSVPTMARGLGGTLAANQVEAYVKGNKVLQEYTKPGTVGGDYARIVDALIASGGRVEMPRIYRNSSLENFFKALRTGNVPGAVFRAPFAAIEAVSYPLMQNVVPRLKLGVFTDMARHEIERMGPNVSREEFRRNMGKIWDSVDNRMGELVYDNLFWNKTLKDLSFLMVRAVGWNLGTIRELGGGVLDTATIVSRLKKGDPAITKRMAYTVALPFTVGLMGAMYQYMKTGQPSEELRDYFYPKTGQILPDGTVERVNFPSYLKDIVSYKRHPFTTFGHKLHPMWSQTVDMLNNKDFYGTQIRNPDDPLVQQVQQVAKFVAGSYVPFSVKGATRRVGAKESFGTKLESFFGIMPISPEIARTPAQNKIMDYSLKSLPKGARTPEEQQRHEFNKDIQDSMMSPRDFEQARTKLIEGMRKGTLTRGQMLYQRNKLLFLTREMQRGRTKSEAQWLWRFNHLNPDEAQHVFEIANPQEKTLFARSLLLKRRKMASPQ